MCNHIYPLAIPAQQAAPHLKALVHAYLPFKAAHHAAQHDAPSSGDGLAVGAEDELAGSIVAEGEHTGLQQDGGKVGARDVKIGEVGGVGLVKVIVTFIEPAVGGGDGGEEEGGGAQGWGDVGW